MFGMIKNYRAILALLLCGVIILVGFSGCATSTEEEAPPGAIPPASMPTAKIGEEASDGQAAVTVHSVKFYDQITGGLGGTFKPRQEGDVYAIVDLSVRSVGDFALKVGPDHVHLLDNENNRYSRMKLTIAGWPDELKNLVATAEELPPGEETRGVWVFSVKEGTILDRVTYTTATIFTSEEEAIGEVPGESASRTPSKPTIEISAEDLEVSIPPYRMPRVGEVASGGGIEMRISSVDPIEKLEQEYSEEEFKLILTETAKEGYELVVVDISIRNVSIEPNVTINSLNVLLIDTESKAYDKVALTIALAGELSGGDLSPGEETWGRLLFSVPAGVELDRVMYKIGTLGPPVQVSLRG